MESGAGQTRNQFWLDFILWIKTTHIRYADKHYFRIVFLFLKSTGVISILKIKIQTKNKSFPILKYKEVNTLGAFIYYVNNLGGGGNWNWNQLQNAYVCWHGGGVMKTRLLIMLSYEQSQKYDLFSFESRIFLTFPIKMLIFLKLGWLEIIFVLASFVGVNIHAGGLVLKLYNFSNYFDFFKVFRFFKHFSLSMFIILWKASSIFEGFTQFLKTLPNILNIFTIFQ